MFILVLVHLLPSWYILQTFGPAFVAIKSIPSVNISPAHKIDMAMLRACMSAAS